MATVTLTYVGPGGGSTKTITFANTDLTAVQNAFTDFYRQPGQTGLLSPDDILALLATGVQLQVQSVLRRYIEKTTPPSVPPVTQS
jgi:hypothetical protein